MKILNIYYSENGQIGCITTPDKWYEKVKMCSEDYLLEDFCRNQPNVCILGVRYYRNAKRAFTAWEVFYKQGLITRDSSVTQHSKFKKGENHV